MTYEEAFKKAVNLAIEHVNDASFDSTLNLADRIYKTRNNEAI